MADTKEKRERFSKEKRPQIMAPCVVPDHHKPIEDEAPASDAAPPANAQDEQQDTHTAEAGE